MPLHFPLAGYSSGVLHGIKGAELANDRRSTRYSTAAIPVSYMTHSEDHTSSPAMSQCIDDCHACANSCNATMIHCLNLGSGHSAPRHIALLLDCAALCEVAATSMSRSSVVHADICRACAAVCRACEFQCRRIGLGEVMQRCADACRRCAESCERIAA